MAIADAVLLTAPRGGPRVLTVRAEGELPAFGVGAGELVEVDRAAPLDDDVLVLVRERPGSPGTGLALVRRRSVGGRAWFSGDARADYAPLSNPGWRIVGRVVRVQRAGEWVEIP